MPSFPHDSSASQADEVTDSPGQDGLVVPEELAQLRQRLDSLPVIEQAKGLLMGHFGIDAEAAFQVLRRWSMGHNRRVRDLSETLVGTVSRATSSEEARQALTVIVHRLNE